MSVGSIRDRQRMVLLAYYNGWSREQLSEKFNTPLNTVKTWLRRQYASGHSRMSQAGMNWFDRDSFEFRLA